MKIVLHPFTVLCVQFAWIITSINMMTLWVLWLSSHVIREVLREVH